ncbi:MAG TPA: hypothetical protein ENF21_07725 [Bacteroidetes bacterium]|nr:hypothetical protein [Bacteroidota bacterium]
MTKEHLPVGRNKPGSAGESFEVVVKTFHGLEELLAQEIRVMTGKPVRILHRAVSFRGDMAGLYRANYQLNTAVRVLRTLCSGPAGSREAFYGLIRQYPWEKIMSHRQSLRVDVVGSSQIFRNTRYAARLAKDAVADRFRELTGQRPDVDLEYPDIRIHILLQEDRAVVSLDSSGDSLHQRGYRTEQVDAPLNEVLASALVMFSGWDRRTPFIDPMCGSGTILLEAARLAMNIPPGYRRRVFAFEKWKDHDPDLWRKVVDRAHENERQDAPLLLGGDISAAAIDITARNAERAGLRRHVRLAHKPFDGLVKPAPEGTIIMNPPYGERLKMNDQLSFYSEVGKVLKHKFTGYRAWILSSNREALKALGLKTIRRTTLYNGPLASYFYGYDLYTGTRKSGNNGSGNDTGSSKSSTHS